jgi:hypothetical protein
MTAPLISPSIGRVVWFYKFGKTQSDAGEQPHAALVAHVWTDRCVNLACFDANGTPYASTSVTLLQGDEEPLGQTPFACWMPYQVGQAKKHETAQA